jgi:hypothetical protein
MKGMPMVRNNVVSLISSVVISNVFLSVSIHIASLIPQVSASIIFFILAFIYFVPYFLVGRFLCELQDSDMYNFRSVSYVSILNLILLFLLFLRVPIPNIATSLVLSPTTVLIGGLLEWTRNEWLKFLVYVIPLTNSFIIFLGLQMKKVKRDV